MNSSSNRASYARMPRFFTACAIFLLQFACNSSRAQCLTATNGQYPGTTFTPGCTGSAESISSVCYAGEYSVVALTGGVTYTFTSSVATDFITISNSGGTTALASGLTPLSYTPAGNVTVRFYTHTSSACGSQSVSRTRSVACAAPVPVNNDCSGAISLNVNTSGCGTTTSGTTAGATQSQAGCTGTADDDVWYKFVATGASHVITVTPGTLSNAVLEVFSGSCGALTSLGCVNSTTGSSAETTTLTGLTGGSTYYLRIYSNGNATGQGTFTACVSTPVANDNCSGALTLTVNPTSTITTVSTFVTTGATQSQAGCLGTADDDVWFKFTATAYTHNFAVTSSTGADLMHQVFSGSCGALTSVICSDPNTSSSDCFVPGQVYYVRVYTYGSGTASGTVTLGVGTATSAADASCATSSQICAPFTFKAGQNQPSGGGGCTTDYGCLTSQPNPEYHWIRVQSSGTVAFTYASSAGVDIDYALWGPFNAPNNPNPPGCSQLQGLPAICGAALGAPVSCDYTTASSGTMTSVNAVAGQYFLLLVTNFANAATTITIGTGAGTATVACPTIITGLTATPGACSGASNQYTLTGVVSTTNAPNSGTLTISDNNGNSQIFNAPFAASINYSIAGNTANGALHTVTAIYSVVQSAARCMDYTAPAACCTTPAPAVTNTTDNTCGYSYDLTATGGTAPYEWSTSSSFSPLLSTLTGYTLGTPGASAVYFVRSAGQSCYASINVTDPTPAGGLTTGNCQTCNIADMQTRTFYDAANMTIATVTDGSTAGSLGATTACATVDASPMTVNGQHFLQRHFDISVANNGPGTVTLYLTQAEINNLIAASAGDGVPFTGVGNMCLMAYHGGAGTPSGHTAQEIIPNSALTITGPDVNNNYSVTFPVSGFSGFYCYACNQNIALPVQLEQFTGVHVADRNLLGWTTASEQGINHFTLERSEDGRGWSDISSAIPALGGAGEHHYQFVDSALKVSTYYYRLRIADYAGSTYSQTVRLASGRQTTLSVYPNPATTLLNVVYSSAEDQDVNVLLVNAQGQLIREIAGKAAAAKTPVQLPVQDLAAGLYYVQIKDSHGAVVASQKFVRQ